MQWKLITTAEDLNDFTKGWNGLIACDTETHGKAWDDNRHLLGISLAWRHQSLYIPLWVYEDGIWKSNDSSGLKESIQKLFDKHELIGHNFTYDKRWLQVSGFTTTWEADTRLMWHMASAPSGPKSYGLKDAQVELLGWVGRGDEEMEEHVRARGGKLKDGQHYLADVEILGKYACLDAYATYEVYNKLLPFFVTHDYFDHLSAAMAFNELLDENTYQGVHVDLEGLRLASQRLKIDCERYTKLFMDTVADQIADLELDWADRKASTYKRDYNRQRYMSHTEAWKRFNLNSDADKRELFYDKLKLPVFETTEGGKPSTSSDALKHQKHPGIEAYLKYEKANTLLSSFVNPYLDSVGPDSKLHPGFNICGTVSYRLSGFKPYLLNAPFDEKAIMQHLQVPEGCIGLHADLAAIEPTITAEYSQDPALLKVFRDGLGDIYLDLALTLFPNDKELHAGYNPNIPITKQVKQRFEHQRKVAKVIQLAVQYTGTGVTVAKNLTREGIPTSIPQAHGYVGAYWKKFQAVQRFNKQLKEINRRDGYLRNVTGRIIRVPDPEYKDLSNRFIQSSAHDVLVLWVLEIYRLCKERGIQIKPVLLDCHDSTSNSFFANDIEGAREVYRDALTNINNRLGLSVIIKAETKTFKTLAGLKGEE